MVPKVISLRLTPEVYRKAVSLAEARQVSINQLFQDGLEALAEQERQCRLYEDFSLLGADRQVSDVDFALAAQREIIEKP